MAETAKPGSKKPYSKPALIVYGTVREVTLKAGNMGNKDGGTSLGAMMSRL
jgi:hypothetical protein